MTAFFSGEYSINQRWALAFDSQLTYQKKSRFSGRKGKDVFGLAAQVGLPESVQFSFAPEFEYNFGPGSGLLAGLWFTVFGKNSSAFASAFLAYLHVF